jgi:hypothetical protein
VGSLGGVNELYGVMCEGGAGIGPEVAGGLLQGDWEGFNRGPQQWWHALGCSPRGPALNASRSRAHQMQDDDDDDDGPPARGGGRGGGAKRGGGGGGKGANGRAQRFAVDDDDDDDDDGRPKQQQAKAVLLGTFS